MKPTLKSTTLLDRQSHLRADAIYLSELADRDDARYLVLSGDKPVIVSNEERTEAMLRWFTAAELDRTRLGRTAPYFLGVDRATGAGRFALSYSEHRVRTCSVALGLMRPAVDLRSLASQGIMPTEELSLAGQAKALSHWHENAHCCGRCGAVMHARDGGWRRKCWACGNQQFPRTDPVVIMLILHPDGDSCLLGRSPRFAEKMFSTLAGFLEPGEDIADAVRRETMEEAGVQVGEVGFHSAQPWPFPHSLMIGCIGQALTTRITLEDDEIVEARWFGREEARSMLDGTHPAGLFGPGRQAIARYLVMAFLEQKA